MSREDTSAELVGRTTELAALTGALDALGDGSARCMEVYGEPGIGKSRLLREAAAIARRRGVEVLWGAATEFERHTPFGIVTNALERRVENLSEAELAALGDTRIGLLRSVFPFLPAPRSAAAAVADAERYLLHRALRALLEVLAQPSGLVLVLDDIHWADEGSAELLDHLFRHPPQAPVLLVAAYRPRQLAPRLYTALAAAAARGFAQKLEVGPLTAEQAAMLVGTAAAGEVYAASGGNPFYLEALTRSGAAAVAPGSVDDPDGVAAPVRAALTAELAALAPAHRLVAHAAGVAGDPCDADTVAAIAGVPAEDVLNALDALAARDLIRAADVPGRFRFRHPLVRHVVYENAAPGWRVGAHGRAAEAMRAQGVGPAARAHHIERSAAPGDLESVQLLTDAALATMHTTPASAAHWLGAALRLLPSDDTALYHRLGLLGLRARALGVCGRLRESRTALREVIALLPAEPAEARAQVVGFCAQIERLLGEHDAARSLLEAELASTGRSSAAAALVTMELAAGHLFQANFDAARDWAMQALQIARRCDDRLVLAASLATCVLTSYSASRVDERVHAWADEAALIIDALPDADIAGRLDALVSLGWAELNLMRNRPALRHLSRGLAVARSTGQNHAIPYLLISLATAQGMLGSLTEAIATVSDALDTAAVMDSGELRRIGLSHLCWLHTWAGDLAAARAAGEEALEAATERIDWFSGAATLFLAQLNLFSDDPQDCIDLVLAAGGGADLQGIDQSARAGAYQQLAAAASALDDPEGARAWAERAEATAAELGIAPRTAFSDMAWSYALQTTDPAEAAARALAAAETFAEGGVRVEVARAHMLAGVAFGMAGDIENSRAGFARCRALADECGSTLIRDLAVREERRMNARRPRRAAGDDAELTEREREVADRVARGLTNRQIAEELFLSPRTVEAHLSRAFAKLGVNTRAALAGRWHNG
jgi:DNA-binding NarL/FixJ family response regulator